MIRKLPEQTERIETGPTQFGEDWPGTFIRGDNAFAYAMALSEAIERLETVMNKRKMEDFLILGQLENLRDLLKQCQSK